MSPFKLKGAKCCLSPILAELLAKSSRSFLILCAMDGYINKPLRWLYLVSFNVVVKLDVMLKCALWWRESLALCGPSCNSSGVDALSFQKAQKDD